MVERTSGILLHITSLPGPEGTGTLGREASGFIDILGSARQKYWQILPLGPTGYGNSPYQCFSAFAGNPLLIDLHELKTDFLLSDDDIEYIPSFPKYKADFNKANDWKLPLLKKAHKNFNSSGGDEIKNEYYKFLDEHNWWLNDYALFIAARQHFKNTKWNNWEEGLRFRTKEAIVKYEKLLSGQIEEQKFIQFLFFRQWFRLKSYANSKGIYIIGDLPLYISEDSSDVWSNTDIFQLDENLEPIMTGGVPPDYFSETGQLWGNPVYDWQKLKERDFDWWMARLHFNMNMFDKVRIDHFRGLESYWAVPAGEKTAVKGKWFPAGGFHILSKLKMQTGRLPFLAEDLGVITPEVDHLRDYFHLPGMKVLQFAFTSDPENPNMPHNYLPRFTAYTGTHDNNTTLGWIRSLKGSEKKLTKSYLGTTNKRALFKAIDCIWSSCAETAIMPMQDLLCLGKNSRMNTPGTSEGNWMWRYTRKQLKPGHIDYLKTITVKYNRCKSATS